MITGSRTNWGPRAGALRRALPLGVAVLLALVACGPRFDVAAPAGGTQAPPSGDATAAPVGGGDTPSPGASVQPNAPRAPRTPPPIRLGGRDVTVKGGTIKVGGLFPLSGGLSAMGTPAWQGAEAYFRYVNEQGGIRGHRFEFVECDDQASDTQSTTCAKKLVEQDGIFLMGPSFTPFSLTVVRQLAEAGVPWVGYDGINLEGFQAENVVTIGAPIDTMAHALLPYWFDAFEREHGRAPKRIGAVTLDVAPAVTYVREAQQRICPVLGCEIVRDQRVSYTTTDYTTICRSMANERVDAVWIVTDAASAVKLLVQCQSQNFRYLGQHGVYLDLTLQQSGRVADGMIANGAVVPEGANTPATEEMKRIVRRYYPDADFGYWTSLAFASARMLVDLVGDVLASGQELSRTNVLAAARRRTSYDCHGLCKDVNLAPPAARTGGNHNIWLVRAEVSGDEARWVPEAGPIDAFRSRTWPCPGRPKPC